MRQIRFSADGTLIAVGSFVLLFGLLQVLPGALCVHLAILTTGSICGVLAHRHRGGRGIVGGGVGGATTTLVALSLQVLRPRPDPWLDLRPAMTLEYVLLSTIVSMIVGAVAGLFFWGLLSNPTFPRDRPTVRRLMIAVASVALALGFYESYIRKWKQLSAVYHDRAEAYAQLSPGPGSFEWDPVTEQFEYRDKIQRVRHKWTVAMSEKYWRLAAYPWLPVEPDPPPPPDPKVLAHLSPSLVPVRNSRIPSRRIPSLRTLLTFIWNSH